VVQRQGDKLVTVPYSVIYKPQLDKAAGLLDQAAAITTNPSLKRFLTLRATSFRTNDYFQSEMAWMDLTGTPIEVAIGPYETYTDELYGQKTAFEAFVTLKDPAESKALDKYKGYLKAMEASLPVEDRYKNFKRGGDSPLAVAEQVRGGGDNTEGPQTIAFNLPNDERVREAKGAKKVILSNVLGAKYDRILKPIGERALVAQQAPLVNKKYMTLETLFHELSHSLGPGSITVDGRATTVSAEMKDIGGTAEEAKADVMGVYNILFMMEKNELPAAERPQLMATYMAGIFRAVRWGDEEAHGRGAALQYGYLKSKGAFAWDPAQKRFKVDDAKMAAGIKDIVADLVRLQGDGELCRHGGLLRQVRAPGRRGAGGDRHVEGHPGRYRAGLSRQDLRFCRCSPFGGAVAERLRGSSAALDRRGPPPALWATSPEGEDRLVSPHLPPQCLRRLAEGADEGPAHALRIAEAGLERHVLDLQRLAVQQRPGRLDAQALDGLGRSDAGLGGEQAGEVARAHGGAVGQLFDAETLGQVLASPGHQGVEAAGLQVDQGRELRLAPGAAVIDHQLLGGAAGHRLAFVGADQGQRQVDAGGDARRTPDHAVLDEDLVGLQPDGRIAFLDILGAAPVGGGALAVQKAGLGQDVGARTDAGDAPRRLRRAAHIGQGGLAACGNLHAVAARDDQGVQLRSIRQRGRGHGKARGAGDHAAVTRQEHQAVSARRQPRGDFESRDRAGGVQ
jgi:hypothetical protein